MDIQILRRELYLLVERVSRYKTENGIDYKQCSICLEWFIKGEENFYIMVKVHIVKNVKRRKLDNIL